MIRFTRLSAAIATLALVALVPGAGPSSSSGRTIRWREYTYKQALAAGLVTRAQFARPKGEPLCGPMPAVIPSAPDNIPDNAPTCYRPPEQQRPIFLVPEGAGPGSGEAVFK